MLVSSGINKLTQFIARKNAMFYFKSGVQSRLFFYRLLMLSLVLVVSFSLYAQGQDNENPTLDFYKEQVRINEADAETIARNLDGVGITRAEAIVDFCGIYGEFTSLEDLQLVKGVGEVTLRNNESRILFD